jgi:hypothetical protein
MNFWPWKKPDPEPERKPSSPVLPESYVPWPDPTLEPDVELQEEPQPEPEVEPEAEPAPPTHVAPEPIPPRTLSEHELDVKAHHEKLLKVRDMEEGPDKEAAWKHHGAEAKRIRMFKHLSYSQDDLRAQFWDLQFQIEDLKAEWESKVPGSDERFAVAAKIDELAKHRSHIVYALKRADGSFSVEEPIGHTGRRPMRGS